MDRINQVERAYSTKQYRWLREYTVLKFHGLNMLVKNKILNNFTDSNGTKNLAGCPKLAYLENLFDILFEAHDFIGHGMGEKTFNEIKKKYSNISRHVCIMFVSICPLCAANKVVTTRKEPLKAILSDTFNDRGQIDVIDMQATPDGQYRWILHYQDHLTKFTYLRAIRKKSKLILEIILVIFFVILCRSL